MSLSFCTEQTVKGRNKQGDIDCCSNHPRKQKKRHPKIQVYGQPTQPCYRVPGQPDCIMTVYFGLIKKTYSESIQAVWKKTEFPPQASKVFEPHFSMQEEPYSKGFHCKT